MSLSPLRGDTGGNAGGATGGKTEGVIIAPESTPLGRGGTIGIIAITVNKFTNILIMRDIIAYVSRETLHG